MNNFKGETFLIFSREEICCILFVYTQLLDSFYFETQQMKRNVLFSQSVKIKLSTKEPQNCVERQIYLC